jgi:hypothetical protein
MMDSLILFLSFFPLTLVPATVGQIPSAGAKSWWSLAEDLVGGIGGLETPI